MMTALRKEKYMKRLMTAALIFLSTAARADFVEASKTNSATYTMDAETMTTAVAHNYPTTGTIDTGKWNYLDCQVVVTAGAARAIIPKCYADSAGVTLTYTYDTLSTSGATGARYVFGAGLYGLTADDDQVMDMSHVPPCRYMRLTMASAGPGTVQCSLRR